MPGQTPCFSAAVAVAVAVASSQSVTAASRSQLALECRTDSASSTGWRVMATTALDRTTGNIYLRQGSSGCTRTHDGGDEDEAWIVAVFVDLLIDLSAHDSAWRIGPGTRRGHHIYMCQGRPASMFFLYLLRRENISSYSSIPRQRSSRHLPVGIRPKYRADFVNEITGFSTGEN